MAQGPKMIHQGKMGIRYGNPRGIRMVFVVSDLVKLVYMLKPKITHLEINSSS